MYPCTIIKRRKLRSIFLFFTISFLLPFLLFTQQASGAKSFSPHILHMDLSHYPCVKVVVSVTDIANTPVAGLNRSNFQLITDGYPREDFKVIPVSKSKEGVAIVLGIDTSGTMRGKPLENAKRAVSEFISRMGPNDKTAIVTFNNDVNIISEFTSNKNELQNAVQGIKIAGNLTKLYDAMFEAIRMTTLSGLPSRRVLIFLSDGKDEGSSATLDDCLTQAKTKELQVYTIGYESILKSVGKKYFKYLERIAKITNCVFFEALKESKLNRFYQEIGIHLQSQYLLTIKDINVKGDGKSHDLQIIVSDEGVTNTVYKKFMAPRIIEKSQVWLYAIAGGTGLFVLIAALVFIAIRKKRAQELPAEEIESLESQEEIEPLEPAEESTEEKEKRKCPVCHRVMAEDWSECLFCKKEAESKEVSISADPGSPDVSKPETQPFGRLVLNNGPQKGKEFILLYNRTNIGIAPENDVVVDDDSFASSNHCRIKFEDEKAVLVDLDSTNGTFLNGSKIKKADLYHQDIIRIGNTELIYYIQE